MTILWINLLFVFLLALFARYSAVPAGHHDTVLPIQSNKLLLMFAAVILILVSGLRSNIGDTFNYVNMYKDNQFTWEYVTANKDMGFGVLQMILQKISTDPQIMIFTAALITNALVVIVLFHYSRMIELSLFVYITGGFYLVSMNGIRQTLAAAIAFCATKFLINGNFPAYAAIIILASTLHQSALILLPIYFIVRVKPWSKATIGLILLSIAIVIGFEQFTSLLFTTLEDTQYADYKNFAEGGANLVRAVVGAVPLILAYIGREKLRALFPQSDVIVNMTLLSLIFMIVSTQSWIFARFSLYFNLYQLILLSWIVKLFRDRDEKFVYFMILVCYLGYYYYESVVSLDIIYKSNFIEF
ncbi:EpsG family protein [Jeotgalibacillus proteolyticus]|uniref:EpsG family protein n=1 Tax=Jeotgalibacillus proteolyticus TaxID=2082395 RepID=A0A2S5G8D6_9BACL|nr:EpsG family protein [Jeotgalibacillus proteolyticus]PPA69239.1 EpsG family protein [Jeotgalibacillus proteolyticus]